MGMVTLRASMLPRLRRYGDPPFDVAVLHGGPGAPGEVGPLAQELSNSHGVLEPFQTEDTVDGQVRELRDILLEEGDHFSHCSQGHQVKIMLQVRLFPAPKPPLFP